THIWRIYRALDGAGADTYPVVFVELSEADGRSGLGETAPSGRYLETVSTVQAYLSKVDATRLSFDDLAGSMAYLESLAADNNAAKTALNIALLDGVARQAQRP